MKQLISVSQIEGTIMLFLLLSASFLSAGQTIPNPVDFTKIIDLLPPSPNAASLGKYGNIDMSLASGSANINIPVFDYSSTNIKFPLSLSYSSSGFKVDELAGRIGSGWSLNAGGVVTRTVYGAIDEQSQRITVPPNFPARTRALVDFMENASNLDVYAPFDAQPDMFSFNFNGYTGRFILDSNLNPVILSHSGIRIERDFSSAAWTFKFTTVDGTQYLFGGDSASEGTSKIQTGCGKNYPNFTPTAWYLKKIIDPANDIVTFRYLNLGFNYKAGISESVVARIISQMPARCSGGDVSAPSLHNTTCVSVLRINSLLLDEISSTGGPKLKFIYITRPDIDDKLLSGIDIYAAGQSTTYKTYFFNYVSSYAAGFKNSYSQSDATLNYRPFLSGLTEKSSDGISARNYWFTYNSINSLPPRLSYAQDDYGYFNGKNNTSLIPHPTDPSWQSFLPTATANRAADPNFSQMGLLASIIYPAGGTDTIIYESNQLYKNVTMYPAQTSVIAPASHTGLSGSTIVYSGPAAVTFLQKQRLSAICSFNGTTGQDPLHDKATVELLDVNTNLNIFSQALLYGQTLDVYVDLLAGHSYKIKSSAFGSVTVGATLYYQPGNLSYQYMNINTGGVRVKKIISSDKMTSVVNIKKYLYGNLSAPDNSSGGPVYSPFYEKILRYEIPCPNGGVLGGIVDCSIIEYDYYSMYSNSQNNIYAYPSSPVSYSSVIESFGDNFENGGIEHQFTVFPDVTAVQLVGDGIFMNTPLSNYSWKNAREVFQHVFKVQGITYIPVKKVFTHYNEDARADHEFKTYIGNKKYNASCINSTPSDIEINAYDLYTYSIFRKWVYADTLRTLIYDVNGQSYVEQLNVTAYSNATHALPTKQTTYAGSGGNNVISTIYPQDIILTGSEETARLALVSRHMTGIVLQQHLDRANNQAFNLKTSYNVFANGLVLPQTHNVQIAGNPMEERVRFYNYNNYGKILDQAKSLDLRQSTVWDNQSNNSIAQVINASYSEIAYSSFETDAHGNWIYTGASSADASAPTGSKCYPVANGSISITGITNTKSYIVSYWCKNVPAIVNSTAGIAGVYKNGWTYYEHRIPAGTLLVTVSGSAIIDELRLYPSDAQMISETYIPSAGISSQCDANNKITYYEYDGLARLSLVRDGDRNIIKKFCYNYTGQAEVCGFGTIPIWQNTNAPIRCKKNALSQNTGEQEQEQKDINSSSSSFNQLRWVIIATNLTLCPITVTFYAKIVLTDIYNDLDYSSANAWINFYSDAACTVTASVSALSVSYKKVVQICAGSSATTNYSINCTGTQLLLGNLMIARHDGIHCDNTTYSVITGSGYIPK